MASIRRQKIESLLKRELSIVFQKHASQWIAGTMVTVTAVTIAPDLANAKVYLSLFPGKEKEKLLTALVEKMPEIKRMLASGVGKQLRRIPMLDFYLDDALDRVEQIDKLLKPNKGKKSS